MALGIGILVVWVVAVIASIVQARRSEGRELPYVASISGLAIAGGAVAAANISLRQLLPDLVSYPMAVLLFLPTGLGWLWLVGRSAGMQRPLWKTPSRRDLVGAHAVVFFFAGAIQPEVPFASPAAHWACITIGIAVGMLWAAQRQPATRT
jgi:hypothetical protein